MRRHTGIPLFIGAMVTLLLIVAITWFTLIALDYRAGQERKACEVIVSNRDDARSMFVWVGEEFPGEDFVIDLNAALDVRLPRLQCIDNIPTPIPQGATP